MGIRCIFAWILLQLFGRSLLDSSSRIVESLWTATAMEGSDSTSFESDLIVIAWMIVAVTILFVVLNLLIAWASRFAWLRLAPENRGKKHTLPIRWVYAKGPGWGICQLIGVALCLYICLPLLSGAIRAVASSEQSLAVFWFAMGHQILLYLALGCLILGMVEFAFARYRCRSMEAKLTTEGTNS